MENVWNEVLPLYELIHAYVRRKLREYYGPNRISRNAPLPAHVSFEKSENKTTSFTLNLPRIVTTTFVFNLLSSPGSR